MKESKIICPYCHKPVTNIEKDVCHCSCRVNFKLSQALCPVCFSQVIKIGQLYFCSNKDCPNYSDIYTCPFTLDKSCDICNRQLVKILKMRAGLVQQYQYVNLTTGCELNNLKEQITVRPRRNLLVMELTFHPVLHDLYQKFKNQNPKNA